MRTLTSTRRTAVAGALFSVAAASVVACTPGTGTGAPAGSTAGTATSPTATATVPTSGPASVPALPAAARGDASATAAWEALFSRQGEYAAYAAYSAVLAKFGSVEPYASIRDEEARHVAALTRQLERMGIAVPANPYLGRIAAPSDLVSAARAWANGEVANIAMYDRLLTQVRADPALTRVFTNLRRASAVMHLPAFRAAADNGGTLAPGQVPAGGMGPP